MKLHKNNLGMLERAKKTLFGRIVMRLAGEEKGAIMMEYVIVATLIAAAVALGAWFFGSTILRMFGVGAVATAGGTQAGAEASEETRTSVPREQEEAIERAKDFITDEKKDAVQNPVE